MANKHIWEISDKFYLEYGGGTVLVYESMQDLKDRFIYGDLTILDAMHSRTSIVSFWKWEPSLNKARMEKIESMLEMLDEDDSSCAKCDVTDLTDTRLGITYVDQDYLIIETMSIDNGRSSLTFKIYVSDADEDNVRELLKTMRSQTIETTWGDLEC
jgi:hypothetical protein